MAYFRRHRLPADAYRVDGSTWHVTVSVAKPNGSPFLDTDFGKKRLASFLRGYSICDAVPHLICLTPDHMHLLIEVRSVGLVDLMRRTKSYSTQLWWKRGGYGALRQESFYDHGVRDVPDFETIATYILNNPVEAGLVSEWESYPLFGGKMLESVNGDGS
jgi:REP element-mobilizing transposase RayT